jgi:methionyl-tRNA formyltransferase
VLTVAFFGVGGEGSQAPLEALAKDHRVVAVVRPLRARSWIRGAVRSALIRSGFGHQAAMSAWARRRSVPLIDAVSGRDPNLASRLKELAPDVICVSAFPWLLGGEILQTARWGALNVHPSLLPRHRGPNPLFWLYYHSDRLTGVTVHRMNEFADAGEVLAQYAFDLPRGFTIDRLYAKNATLGANLLVQVLGEIETGTAQPVEQDKNSSTYAPRVAQGQAMVDFSGWDVERVWHFLSGLCSRRREPLRDAGNREVRYISVLGYTPGDCDRPPGAVERAPFGWNLYCRGGSIQLADARNGRWGPNRED